MATTLKADVFVPEVATAVATAQFPNQLAVSLSGQPFVAAFPPEAALGEEGDAVKFPRWNPLGEFTALTEDVAMTPEKLTSALDTATVQVAGKAVEITDFAELASRGSPNAEVGTQMAKLAARYIDARLIVEAETTALTTTLAGTATWGSFVSAIITHWGDQAFDDVGGLVVHSKVFGDMLNLDEFKRADFVQGQSSLADRASGDPIGFFGGYPVWISNRIAVDTVPIPDTYANLILKRGGLGLKFQRELRVEQDRDILKKNWVIAGDVRFAVHLMYGNPSPVIKWVTQ